MWMRCMWCIPYTNEISMDSGNQTSIWQSRRRVRLLKLIQCAVGEWHGAHPRLLNTWSLTSTTPPCILWILWILSASSRPVRPVCPVCPVWCPSKAMLVPSSITSSEFSKCGKSKSWVTIQRSTTKRHPATTIRPTLERCVTEFPCWYVARALWLRKNGWDAQQHHHTEAAPQEMCPMSFPKARNIQAAAQAVHAVVLQNQVQHRKDGQGVSNESSTLRQMCESVVPNVQVIGDVTTTFHIFTGTRRSVAIAKDLPSNPVVDLGTKNEINDQNCCSDDEVTALVGKHLKAQGQSGFQDLGEEDSS